ncbi:MAG: PEP-CTERM sorting domain-containing protein [Thiobacillus sp.]
MNMKMTRIAAAVVMSGFSALASAAGGVGTVSTISFTGGDFNMGGDFSAGACGLGGAFGSWQCIPAGATINANDGLFEASSIVTFNFFNAPVTTFTAATAAGAAASTSGNPIQGSATASAITLDLGSFYANWSGSNFLQAPSHAGPGASTSTPIGVNDSPLVTGTYDSGTGAFDISWASYITTAPFANQTGYWHLSGVATTVPVPEASTYGMMLAGLGLVGFAVRRRKLVA